MHARYLAATICLAVAACQTTPTPVTIETDVSAKLPPMEEPAEPMVGYTAVMRVADGSEIRIELVEVSEKTLAWRDSKGCEWSRSREYDWRFAPSIEWRNCRGSTGTRTIKGRTGDPVWPLEVGKRWRYQATGYTQNAWNADEGCEVAGTARIETVSGTHDTYKVVCTSQWARTTRYFSPELGDMVRYQREHLAGRASNAEGELIRIEKPAES